MGFINAASNIIPLATGFQTGYQMHKNAKAEKIVTQGQNYILGSIAQVTQGYLAFSEVTSVISKILSLHPTTKMFSKPLSYLLFVPGCALITLTIIPAALFRNDKFTEIANFVNGYLPKNWQINPTVTDQQKKEFVFISNYSGDISQIITAVCSVASFALGFRNEAIGTLAVMGIGYLDRKGILNERVSFFLNENLSTITNIASIILGSPLQKALGLTNLVTSSDFIMKKVSYYIEDRIKPAFVAKGIHYPSLKSTEEKIDATTNDKFKVDEILGFDSTVTADQLDKMDDKALSAFFKKIENEPKFNNFLKCEGKELNKEFERASSNFPRSDLHELDKDVFKLSPDGKTIWKKIILAFGTKEGKNFTRPLEIDPSHVQRTFKLDLNSDAKYQTLNDLFDKIGFEGKALDLLIKNIGSDDRFIKEYLIDENNQALRDLEKIKHEPQGKKDWEKALLGYGKNQLATFVKALTGEQLPVGVNSGINDVRKSSKFLIAHLENLHKKIEDKQTSDADKDSAKNEAQSIISTLLIQGGGYCFDGVVVAVDVCLNKVLANGYGLSGLQAHLDFMAQEIRTQSFEQMYALVMNPLWNPLANLLGGNDVHMVNLAKRLFSRGVGLDRSAAVADGGSTKYPLVELFFATSLPVIRALIWNNDINKATMINDVKNLKNILETNAADIQKIYKTAPFDKQLFADTYRKEIENLLSYSGTQVTMEIEIESKNTTSNKILKTLSKVTFYTDIASLADQLDKILEGMPDGPISLKINLKRNYGNSEFSNSYSESYDKSVSQWKMIRGYKKIVEMAPKIFANIGNGCLLGTLFGSVAFNDMASFPYNERELITRAKKRIEDSKSGQGVAGLRDQYITWWNDYIKTIAKGDEEKQEELEDEVIFGSNGIIIPSIRSYHEKVLNEKTGQYETKEIFEDYLEINEKYLKIMLIEMGFLRKP